MQRVYPLSEKTYRPNRRQTVAAKKPGAHWAGRTAPPTVSKGTVCLHSSGPIYCTCRRQALNGDCNVCVWACLWYLHTVLLDSEKHCSNVYIWAEGCVWKEDFLAKLCGSRIETARLASRCVREGEAERETGAVHVCPRNIDARTSDTVLNFAGLPVCKAYGCNNVLVLVFEYTYRS